MAKIKVGELSKLYARIQGKVPDILRDGLLEAADHVNSTIKQVVMESAKTDRTTGALARSFKAELVETKGGEVTAQAVSRLSYARIQDEGGTIYPKTTKALAVPFPTYRPPVGRWPRHEKDLTFIPRIGKDPLLAKITKGKAMEPRWILKKSVTIKPKHYLDTARTLSAPGVYKILGKHLDLIDKV